MSADRIYVDPSALRSLYLHDGRSRAMARWRRRHPAPLPVTHHGRVEIVNAMALAVFRGDIAPVIMTDALGDLDDDFVAGRLVQADLLWRRALDRAAELSRSHTPRLGTRSLDVLHVACAAELGCTVFISYDVRQQDLAKAVGLRIVAPE